ncbi:aspartate--tRNA(Asn) ligase [Candidatus Similichlamydia laticola]|uniref:Aspartyl-tRNA synthetase n=1 Tax=Candidatus Similichlamydia laticola TaxID=2170265 RepID=A0A369KEZ8_9BACT|nr:aspartate--tRNA(Asn) ligase [Candidatus Similichlamydia laticola]RDB31467.1 Aspartyl-tRNA synthetase [Candidatus Similichlamydia laticola]
MLRRVFSRDLPSYLGERVVVQGWLHALRSLGGIAFLLVRDRDGLVQVVLREEGISRLKDIHIGTVLSVSGLVSSSKRKDGAPELTDVIVDVVSPVLEAPFWDYTRDQVDVDLDFLLDHRGFSLRNPVLASVFHIQGEIAWAFRSYMRDKLEAREFFGPCLLPGASEGGAEVFFTDYFGATATLAQSSQLYKQILVGVYERVFSIMPFFRADPSHTTRHLSEGKQLEFEAGFYTLADLLVTLEDLLRHIVRHLSATCPRASGLLLLPDDAFPRISFREACQILGEASLSDLGSAEEKKLSIWAKEEYGSDFLFVTHWPRSVRPFYSAPSSCEQESETFDLLCSGIEITSGGVRRHTYEQVMQGLAEFNLSPVPFKIYLQAFKAGMPPHGGFGIGLERLTMVLLGLKNIREGSLFPSDYKRIASEKQETLKGEEIHSEVIHLLRRRCVTFSLCSSEKISAETKGLKALLLMGKRSGTFFQANLLLRSRLNMRVLSQIVGEELTFADPKVIEDQFGLKVGSIPPCGSLFGVRTFLDKEAHELKECIYFSSGKPGESIVLEGPFPLLGHQEVVEISI